MVLGLFDNLIASESPHPGYTQYHPGNEVTQKNNKRVLKGLTKTCFAPLNWSIYYFYRLSSSQIAAFYSLCSPETSPSCTVSPKSAVHCYSYIPDPFLRLCDTNGFYLTPLLLFDTPFTLQHSTASLGHVNNMTCKVIWKGSMLWKRYALLFCGSRFYTSKTLSIGTSYYCR